MGVPGEPLWPCRMLMVKAYPKLMHLVDATHGKALVLLANIRLGLKGYDET
jgi:hypothetical protein